jgi:hypothetical protein
MSNDVRRFESALPFFTVPFLGSLSRFPAGFLEYTKLRKKDQDIFTDF